MPTIQELVAKDVQKIAHFLVWNQNGFIMDRGKTADEASEAFCRLLGINRDTLENIADSYQS